MCIPVAGPMLVKANSSAFDNNWTFPALWSLAQGAGLTMFIVGMAGHDVVEYQPRRMVNITPVVTRTFSGLALQSAW